MMGTATFAWIEGLDADALDLRPYGSAPQIRGDGGTTSTMTADDQADRRCDLVDGRVEPCDEDLMLAFRDGDASAFEILVTRHKRGLFNFLLRSVHNQSRAEELL